jgi:hypothetical protein
MSNLYRIKFFQVNGLSDNEYFRTLPKASGEDRNKCGIRSCSKIKMRNPQFDNTGKEHIETTAEKANRYQLFINNKFLYEHKKIKYAIKTIKKMEGATPELEYLLKNINMLIEKHPDFITTGMTYTEKHGLRIEQKLAVKKPCFLTFFSKFLKSKNSNSIPHKELAR